MSSLWEYQITFYLSLWNKLNNDVMIQLDLNLLSPKLIAII